MSFWCNHHKATHDACDECLIDTLQDVAQLAAAVESVRHVWPDGVELPDIEAIRARAKRTCSFLDAYECGVCHLVFEGGPHGPVGTEKGEVQACESCFTAVMLDVRRKLLDIQGKNTKDDLS